MSLCPFPALVRATPALAARSQAMARRCPHMAALQRHHGTAAAAVEAEIPEPAVTFPAPEAEPAPLAPARARAVPAAPLTPAMEAVQADMARARAQCPHLSQLPAAELARPAVSPVSAAPAVPAVPTPKPAGRYEAVFRDTVQKIKDEGRYRKFADLERLAGEAPACELHAVGDEPAVQPRIINWTANDYLCQSQNPVVIDAMTAALQKSGAGSGGTRNISGTNHNHVLLEQELADLHEQEAALLFTSCFVANDATLTALGQLFPGLIIYSDAENHASMIQGTRNARCEKHIYRHNDLAHLEELLQQADPARPKLILFESVNSMLGSALDLHAMLDVARRYDCMTFVDEVHAVGLYGDKGGGLCDLQGVASEMTIISGTLAKGFGVQGGYIAGSAALVDAMRSTAAGFIFTTSMPPLVAAGALASVRQQKGSTAERALMHANAQELKTRLAERGLPVHEATESHIVPVMVCDPLLVKAASKMLLEKHAIYAQPINYPTVPKGEERLRLTPSPAHTPDMIAQLVDALDDVWDTLGLQRNYAVELAPVPFLSGHLTSSA